VASNTRTRYASCGEVEVAYQVLGSGPPDVLQSVAGFIPIECMDEEPALARFERRLASFGQLIRFDRRGVGLSERGSPSVPPTLEQWAEDALAVLDAVGCERAAIVAGGASSLEAITLASAHPERVERLVVVNGLARALWAPDYPDGISEGRVEELVGGVDPDAVEQGFDFLAQVAPSVAGDAAFRAWNDRAGNLGATPAMARALHRARLTADVRDLLPKIRVPTLIIHRADIVYPPARVGHGRYLAEHIPGSKYVELPGADTLYWVGDTTRMLDEIEEFLTGVRGGSGTERVLATVLFTDIVGSTQRAAALGDRGWRDLLDNHDQAVRRQLERFRGREIDTAGDGFFATFDGPGHAIECALAIRDTLKAIDIDVRAGIHTGEIEVRGDRLAGLTVNIGARVSALAGTGEVLVSSTVKDIVAGSGIEFADRGEHKLKGVPGTWHLFAVNA
jgi:class 3 adenylate cyclase